ncbi:MAG: S8 family serine peptidase, partial [Phycisphaerales bacterium]|nr:S8 family serine peptidase [Phycisphaerales bacterium]
MDASNHPFSRIRSAISISTLILLSGSAFAQSQQAPSLQLKAGTVKVSTLQNAKVRNEQRPQRMPDRMVIVLDSTMTPALRKQIAATGARIGDYLPDHAYVVNLKDARIAALRAIPSITHIVDFQDAWKIDPELGNRTVTTLARKAIATKGQVAAQVTLFPSENLTQALKAVANHPGVEITHNEYMGDRNVIDVVGTLAAVKALAKIGAVQWIESASEITMRNSTDRWIVQSNVNGFFPVYDAGIHGENQLVAIMDGRVNVNHCSFTDPEGDPFGDDHRKIQAYNTSLGSDFHGTHVAGTVLGDNNADNNTRGVAYQARLIYNSTPSFSNAAMSARLNLHYSQGAAIHTNSWGDDGTTAYNGLVRAIDAFSYNNDDNLVIFAVTNTSTLKNPENAKNCLAVGASQDSNNQGAFCSGGRGPTADGRRKPEIFAPGCNTRSANSSTSCGTTGLTGTSMAAPAIAGTAALTRQYFEDGYYPSGAAESDDGFTPSGTLIKATLLNSAVNMTGINGFPSNQEGWGRVLLDNALHFVGDSSNLIIRDVRNAGNDAMSTNDEFEINFTVNSISEPLKVTLVWHDPASTPNSNFAPVNNLDLEMVIPGGNIILGNNITNGTSNFGGSPDEINNVEMVMLPATPAGDYTVRVKGTAINQGPQGYAIVITGDVTASAAGCNAADLAEPFGNLNFFDVSAFLTAFSASDSSADLNGDGSFNFFDVSDYLTLFAEGCP